MAGCLAMLPFYHLARPASDRSMHRWRLHVANRPRGPGDRRTSPRATRRVATLLVPSWERAADFLRRGIHVLVIMGLPVRGAVEYVAGQNGLGIALPRPVISSNWDRK